MGGKGQREREEGEREREEGEREREQEREDGGGDIQCVTTACGDGRGEEEAQWW